MQNSRNKRFIQHVYDIQMKDKIQGTKLHIRRDFKACVKFLWKMCEEVESLNEENREKI